MSTESAERKYIKIGTGDLDTMPNSKPGYTVNFFRDLGILPKKLEIKNQLTAVLNNEQEPLAPEAEVSKDPNIFKTEMYVLTAYGIEEVWSLVKAFRDESHDALEDVLDTEPPQLKLFSPEESAAMFSQSQSISEMFYLLRKHTHPYLADAGSNWEDLQEQFLKRGIEPGPAKGQSSRVYQRLGRLLEEGRHSTRQAANDEPTPTPADHILAGMNTGEGMILDIQQVIVETFARQFGRCITVQEFEEISASAKSLIIQIASVNNSVFPVILQEMRVHGRHSNTNPFRREIFSIQQGDFKKSLEVDPEVLGIILGKVAGLKIPAATAKCPAMLAPGQEKKNVISEMYDWYEMLAKKHILPQAPRLFNERQV